MRTASGAGLAPGPRVVGVVLAGGCGRRMAAAGSREGSTEGKAMVSLAGRPLIHYPVAALRAVCPRAAVVAKASTRLPAMAGVERWDEPESPRHPALGIAVALERAGGPVLVCAVDMPFVTAAACRLLLDALAGAPGAPAAVATVEAALQPTLAVYAPVAAPALREAVAHAAPLVRTVDALGPVRVAVPAAVAANVNTPEDLAAAELAVARDILRR